MKYAVVERERRFLVAAIPEGVTEVREIVDRYVTGTRFRLREVRSVDGGVVRKLTHKVRLTPTPAEVACTNMYLDDVEWAALVSLPAMSLTKRRHLVRREGYELAVDEFPDGTLLAEIDDGDSGTTPPPPSWLEVISDVSGDEHWTGAGIAGRLGSLER